ncbi:NADPH-dependent oxidoreductase [Comamonas kerstersii]|uniref:NADPH-dependent oxidoreductase n=1 Tax=Comamonas kerstersii TaxID=225992 RepID=A0A0W7YZJ1_9BURK|nr:NADPH-dependent oxidoreductase [Comamonas kerstersii]KUF40588.1 NADPH-dependent oxidoreductase [Comamonas kerstersii]
MSHTALQARYGDEAPALNLPDLAVLDAMLNHRSVRHFLRDPLPANTVETLVAAAQSAPTSSNLQTWSVIAVESQGRREALANLVGPQRHLAVAPLVLVWLADLSRIERLGKAQGRHPVGLNYLDTFLMGVIDAALAAQNAVVAAEAMGLGTVYVGGMRNQPEEVAKVLGTPSNVFPVFGLVVGQPDPARPAQIKPRLPQSAVLHREQYQLPVDTQAEIGNYNSHLRAFMRAQGMKEMDWSTQVVERLLTPEALTGRHRLYEALRNAGFSYRDIEAQS